MSGSTVMQILGSIKVRKFAQLEEALHVNYKIYK
jgi:hypothetical protein